MPFLLRKVKQERWFSSPSDPLPAEPLADLNAPANELSLWTLGEDRAELEDLVVALASNVQHISKIDVARIDAQAFGVMGFELIPSTGNTRFSRAQHLHCDAINLSADDLVNIGIVIRSQAEFELFTRPEVRKLLVNAVTDGRLSLSRLDERLRKEVETALSREA